MKFTKHLSSLLLMAIILWACSPEDGAPGPEGPQGEQGIQGEQGEKGETGTANVIYSEWVASQFTDNIVSISGQFIVDAPNVTQDIIDQGIVLGFAKNIPISGTPTVFQLPRISDSNQYSVSLVNVGEVRFTVGSIDNSSVGTTLYEEYRYVIIPGGIPASGERSLSDFSSMSYEEIIAYFNIPN